MFTPAIQQFISGLPISKPLKQHLTAANTLHSYRLYIELPRYLAPLFPGITQDQLRDLTIHAYLYFCCIISVDKVVDEHSGEQTSQFLDALALQEAAVCGLTRLFEADNPFWAQFNECKARYASANLLEKQYALERPALTVQEFEHLAAGKSAICFAMVYAMSSLGMDATPIKALLACLEGIHIGSQYFDDVQDFREDARQGQYTYAHHLVDVFIENNALGAEVATEEYRYRYLYTSGTAAQLMSKGRDHYQASLTIAGQLGLEGLCGYLRPELARYTRQLQQVNTLVEQLRGTAAVTLTAGSVPASMLM